MMERKDELLKLIGISGELPACLIPSVIRSESYAAALITKLKKDGLILLRYKDKLRGYSLKKAGKEYLMEKYSQDCLIFLTGAATTNHIKTDTIRRIRLYRMAEVWIYMHINRIQIFMEGKRSITEPVKDAVYYGTQEYKTDKNKELSGSRASGLFFSSRKGYVVYNTMGKLMKWAKKTELTMKIWSDSLCKQKQMPDMEAAAIVFGPETDMALRILESNGGVKGNLFVLDEVYTHLYFIPMPEPVCIQFQLLADPSKDAKLKTLIHSGLDRTSVKDYSLHIGIDEQHREVFQCYDMELWKLRRIQKVFTGESRIICFDYQKAFMEICYPGALIEPLATKKVSKYLEL